MGTMSTREGPSHQLLEAATPSFSNSTVQRAFIVWMHCGQKNSFKDVCNYYHRLEGLEDKLPGEYRTTSRYHEFNMFTTPPPTSPYLKKTFPNLYTQSITMQQYMKKVENLKHAALHKDIQNDVLTKLELNAPKYKGVSKQDILETSQLIQNYCKTYSIPLPKFTEEFNKYASKCELKCTLNNAACYIKRKMVQHELQMEKNYSNMSSFLDFILTDGMTNRKKITLLTRDMRNDAVNLYWKGLTNNYSIDTVRNSVTRT